VVKIKTPHLIILSAQMPGIDGYQVCRSLKAEPLTANIPIILIRDSEDEESMEKIFEAGGSDYISHPFYPAEILVRVRTHLSLFQLRHSPGEAALNCRHENEALLRSEKKFRALFEQAGDYILILGFTEDKDVVIVDANQAAYQFHGYSREEFLGKPVREIDKGLDAENFQALLEQAMSGRTIRFETTHAKKDGTLFPVDVSSKRLDIDDQAYLLSIERDISERKKSEEALRQFKCIVSSSSDMMALLDTDFIYRCVNTSYAGAFNKKVEDIVGHSVAEIFGRELFEKTVKPRADHVLEGLEVRYSDWFEFPNTGRRYLDVQYSPYKGHDNKIKGFVVCARDTTDRKLAEDSLKNSEKKSLAYLQHSPVCTKIVDLDFNLQFMSASGINDLKIDDITEFYGKPYPFHFYPESFKNTMTANMKRVKETGRIIKQEASVVDVTGNELWFHSTIVP
ncbi:MAG: PAS domain S-box protein, partial [bacterium]|nr:PAS domain S-box protein [bacterium]